MKRGYLTYEFFKGFDETSNLAKFFNIVFKKLTTLRMLSAPSFYEKNPELKKQKVFLQNHFYDLCLGELYLHSIIENLTRWQELLKEYNNEFHGSWKYYASSKRMDSIREYGGEESDYNEDGSIKMDVSDDELVCYSFVKKLGCDDSRDIFIDTDANDILDFAKSIIANEKLDVVDMFGKFFGKKLTSYRLKDGEMIENTFADELINKIEREDSAILTANTLLSVHIYLKAYINEIKKLDPTQDNQAFFTFMLPAEIQKILDLKIPVVNVYKADCE